MSYTAKLNAIRNSLNDCRGEDIIAAANYCELEINNNPDGTLFTFDELCEITAEWTTENLLLSTFYGYHANEYDESVESFNPRADYFYFNGYANLCSVWYHAAVKMAVNTVLDSVGDMTDEYDLDELVDLLELHEAVQREEAAEEEEEEDDDE